MIFVYTLTSHKDILLEIMKVAEFIIKEKQEISLCLIVVSHQIVMNSKRTITLDTLKKKK